VLRDWAAARGVRSDLLPDGLQVGDLWVRLVHAELGGYLEAAHGAPLIANAGLDLVEVQAVLDNKRPCGATTTSKAPSLSPPSS
jgi:hypothetical protein